MKTLRENAVVIEIMLVLTALAGLLQLIILFLR